MPKKYSREFEVMSVQEISKELREETEKRYSAFAVDTTPDSKERLTIHSDKKISLRAGDVVKVSYTKTQTRINEE